MDSARLTRAVHFAAGHRYHRSEWSPERNREAFGPCAGAPGHGHNYRCEVTVEGDVAPGTGMVVDLGLLDRLLDEQVVEPMDHAFLNDLDDFAGEREIPTTENICRVVWDRLAPALPEGLRLVRVRIHEDRDLWSDYAGGCPAGATPPPRPQGGPSSAAPGLQSSSLSGITRQR